MMVLLARCSELMLLSTHMRMRRVRSRLAFESRFIVTSQRSLHVKQIASAVSQWQLASLIAPRMLLSVDPACKLNTAQ